MERVCNEELESRLTEIRVINNFERRSYYFASGTDCEIDIWDIGIYIPLELKNYGFPQERKVKIARPVLERELAERYIGVWDNLFMTNFAPLNESLEMIAEAINGSMTYNSSWALGAVKDKTQKLALEAEKNGRDPSIHHQAYLEFESCLSHYKPKGDETGSGICTVAGIYIREAFDQAILDTSLRHTAIGVGTEEVGHDATLVFDINTGHWVVVNSKSPRFLYNLVPLEKLPELKGPFAELKVLKINQ